MSFKVPLATIGILFLIPKVLFAEPMSWQNVTTGIKDTELYSIVVNPKDTDIVYVGSNKAIFRTSEAGKNWQEILGIKGDKKAVNYLNIDPQDTKIIYAATQNGLFSSSDSGTTWRKIFEGMGDLEKDCQSIVIMQGNIYLGTKAGLFYSQDKGSNWNKASGEISNALVKTITFDPNDINTLYLITDKGLYRNKDNTNTFERIHVVSSSEIEDADESESDADEQKEITLELRHLAISPTNLYLATNQGVLISKDKGISWERLDEQGLLSDDIQYILFSDKDARLYVATSGGVFFYTQDKWQALYQGMTTEEVRLLAQDNQGVIWAVAKGGVFKTTTETSAFSLDTNLNQTKKILDYFKDEPTISQVQAAAMKYAEVEPKKIINWRRQARLKAIMPEFDLDYDKTVTTALGATYDRTQVGPRDWGLSLKWDLGELIWNDDQTSIDVRSRLMVQLRDDILDEVTRLYFERRRLKTELLLSPPQDLNKRLEKELRLEELTASIDASTGGYFSRSLNRD